MRPLFLLACLLIALSAPSLAAEPGAGFIHGTVRTADGDSVTGYLRWDGEEAFWDDLFHSRQRDVPWDDYADLAALAREKRNQYFKTHGLLDRLAYALENRDEGKEIRRLFIARFGDLAAIEISADEDVTVVLRTGDRHEVRGYSNDVSADITVYPAAGEPVEFDWDELRRIRFAPAPAGHAPYAERLYGRVASRRGDFEGFIQWDRSECTTIDILDSDQRDVAMGGIAAIRRNPRGGSDVTFRDGSVAFLDGSNDVGRGHRGVVVQTAERGRLVVPWERVDNVEFLTGRGSGAGRDAYAGDGALRGTVTLQDGQRLGGRLVYDLDEARTGDLFDSSSGDLEVAIPFALIGVIRPLDAGGCVVVLHDGQEITCDSGSDAGDGNAGLLVFADGAGDPVHVMWTRIREIRSDR